MGLPIGFQPRACLFCGSRHLMNSRVAEGDEKFQVTCLFCRASGPPAVGNDQAWLSWNGGGAKSPSMFGGAQEMIV